MVFTASKAGMVSRKQLKLRAKMHQIVKHLFLALFFPISFGVLNAAWANPVSAKLTDPTDRYPHNVLGDLPGFAGLEVRLSSGLEVKLNLPDNRVFEDIAPRLWDVDGDGAPEIVVVESDVNLGARLTAWQVVNRGDDAAQVTLRAAGEFIGTRFRWLAPAAIADFSGNGRLEIAYVAMPHLVRELIFVELRGDKFVPVARKKGFSNHRIGQEFITGKVQNCANRPALFLPSADWRSIMRVTYQNGSVQAKQVGALKSLSDFNSKLSCH